MAMATYHRGLSSCIICHHHPVLFQKVYFVLINNEPVCHHKTIIITQRPRKPNSERVYLWASFMSDLFADPACKADMPRYYDFSHPSWNIQSVPLRQITATSQMVHNGDLQPIMQVRFIPVGPIGVQDSFINKSGSVQLYVCRQELLNQSTKYSFRHGNPYCVMFNLTLCKDFFSKINIRYLSRILYFESLGTLRFIVGRISSESKNKLVVGVNMETKPLNKK